MKKDKHKIVFKIGESASFSKTITETDISAYAGLTGDINPIHINAEVTKLSVFGERIAHGMLSASFISTVLGTRFPGEGTILLSQSIEYLKPVRIGDTISATCKLTEVINSEKGIYKLLTQCFNQRGEMIINGNAVVKYPDEVVENTNKIETHSNTTFYTEEELSSLGIASYGHNVYISRNAVLYNPEKLSIGSNVRIDDFTTISGTVVLGDNIHIAQFCGLYGGSEGIYMDDFSGLSSRVVIYATSNDYSGESLTNPMVPDKYKTSDKNARVHLEKHVIIGTTSVILPGVDVRIGCAIGSLSLVLKDCDPWGIYVGSPVKRIKERSKKLLRLEKQMRMEEASKNSMCVCGGGYFGTVKTRRCA